MKLFRRRKVITRFSGDPYLIRYTLFTCKWFSVKVHNILLSDDACLHDHPWAFISLLLKGGYVEHNPKGSKVYGRGSVLVRPAKFAHRLEIHQPVWSLVITFRKVREWGFFTPSGWVQWFRYFPSNKCE